MVKQYRKKNKLHIKNSLLELEKDFKELKDRGKRDWEMKIQKEIGGPIFKPINQSQDDMDKSEEK